MPISDSLIEFLGPRRDLRTITEGEADDWRQSLSETYAEATLNKLVKRARQVFKAAVRKRVCDSNPFAEIRGGSAVSGGTWCASGCGSRPVDVLREYLGLDKFIYYLGELWLKLHTKFIINSSNVRSFLSSPPPSERTLPFF